MQTESRIARNSLNLLTITVVQGVKREIDRVLSRNSCRIWIARCLPGCTLCRTGTALSEIDSPDWTEGLVSVGLPLSPAPKKNPRSSSDLHRSRIEVCYAHGMPGFLGLIPDEWEFMRI